MSESKGINRREFLGSTVAASAAAFTIVQRNVLGGTGFKAPSDQLNIAGIGVGGKGKNNLEECAKAGENIVALCDVDEDYAGDVFKKYPDAKTYKDFRVMLEKQKDIDAVVIATPDHSHAVIALAAMELGKHAYVQKPLTRTVSEARLLTEAARKYNVATQMGNEGHSKESVRILTEWIMDGAIGKVREVHAWTNRPIWPQGQKALDIAARKRAPVPKDLDWDLFLGPAPDQEYSSFRKTRWYWLRDFCSGDMANQPVHQLDIIRWAMQLDTHPVKVQSMGGLLVHEDDREWPDNQTFACQFADGRIGSNPSLASVAAGERLFEACVSDVLTDYRDFLQT